MNNTVSHTSWSSAVSASIALAAEDYWKREKKSRVNKATQNTKHKMSFLRRLFNRKKRDSRAEDATNASVMVVEDADSEYVVVTGPGIAESAIGVERGGLGFSEDPAEVDISAWEMARTWRRRDSGGSGGGRGARTVPGSKAARLAQKLETVRRSHVTSLYTNASSQSQHASSATEYQDLPMDEETEWLYDDKWNRKTKVESRRVRNQRAPM